MFLTYGEVEKRAQDAEAAIEELKKKHLKALERKDQEIKKQEKKIESQEKIEQLKEKLEAARQQNRILANAIVAQQRVRRHCSQITR